MTWSGNIRHLEEASEDMDGSVLIQYAETQKQTPRLTEALSNPAHQLTQPLLAVLPSQTGLSAPLPARQSSTRATDRHFGQPSPWTSLT